MPWIPCAPCGPTPPDALAVIDDDETAAAIVFAEMLLLTFVELTAAAIEDAPTVAATTLDDADAVARFAALAVAVIGALVTDTLMLTLSPQKFQRVPCVRRCQAQSTAVPTCTYLSRAMLFVFL